jgi:hypothetical protein
MNPPSFASFLGYLTRPFFRGWWLVLTGFASILALYLTGDRSLTISRFIVATFTLVAFTLAFFVLAVVSQGWRLYSQPSKTLRVLAFEKNSDIEGGWLLLIEGDVDVSLGAIVDVHKRAGMGEVPLALFRIESRRSDGAYQAVPIGRINPAHIREHTAGGLRTVDLVVKPFIEYRRLLEVSNDLT